MKARIFVTFIVATMALLMLSITPIDNMHAQSKKSKHTITEPAQVSQPSQPEQYDDEDSALDDIGIVDIARKAPRTARHIKTAAGSGNLVYVGDNISTGAGVRIFRTNDQGVLSEPLSAAIPTGGKGAFDVVGFNRKPTGIFAAVDLGPYEEDKDLILNDDGSRLFVCNQGSNDLTIFDISPDGLKLTPVPGSPFKTGVNPISVTIAAFDTVVVLNKNDPPGNPKPPGMHASIMTYKMAANGSLTPVPNSMIELPSAVCGEGIVCGQTSSPSQVEATADGKVVFVNDFMGGFIRPYKVQPDGTLKATKPFDIRSLGIANLPVNGRTFPFSLNFGLSIDKNILYTGLPFENKVGVFSYNPKSGKLKFLRTVPNGGLTVCWFYMKEDGKFFYTTNQVSNSVSAYDLSDPTTPKEIQLVQFNECGEPGQVDASPDERFLNFVVAATTNRCQQSDPKVESNYVHTLRIDQTTGRLIDLPPTPMNLPVGERAQGIITR